MASRSRLFSKIAKDVGSDGNLSAAALSPDVSFGATVYDSTGLLPYVGNDTGDQAYVKSTNRFYIWDSVGWYNVALINKAPSIASVLDSDSNTSPFALATDGTATTITITATDSDGDPITYSATTDVDFSGLATVSQDGNVFTITPFSQDSATTTSGTITFKATDGINIASDINTFTLNFVSPLWDETVLSIATSSTNSLANSTFIDRSTNAHTVTASGSPVQTAFHPYLDNWSADLAPTDYLSTPNSTDFLLENSDFTIEAWIYITEHGSLASGISSVYNSSLNQRSWYFGVTSSSINFNFSTNGYSATNVALSHAATINTNKWYWVSVTRSGDTFSFYVDGNRVGTSTNSSSFFNSNQPHVIGDGNIAGTDVRFGGYISNYRLIKGQAIYTDAIVDVPSSNLQNISGTSLLACQSNRFVDNSSNSHTVTISGTPEVSAYNPFGQLSEYAVGENKGSTLFDKSNYLTYPQDNVFVFGTDDVTIEAWVYPMGVQGDQYGTIGLIYGKATGSGAYWFNETFCVSQTDLRFSTNNQTGNSTYSTLTASNAVKEYQWNHIAFTQSTIDGTRYWSLFSNGVRVEHVIATTDLSALTTGWTHHSGLYPGNAISFDYNGYISDLRIIKGSAIYSGASYTIPTIALGNTDALLYLPMDNAGIYDKSGNNILTLVGNTATSTTQTKFATTSMYFDGTGDYITTTIPGGLGSGDFTIEGWAYHTSLVNWISWVSSTRGTTGFNVGTDASGDVVWYDQVGGASRKIEVIGQISTNTWYHFAFVRSSGVIKAYLDGTQVGSNYSSTQNYSAEAFGIGDTIGAIGEEMYGYLENVQILKGVAKYTTNFTPPIQTQGRTYQAES